VRKKLAVVMAASLALAVAVSLIVPVAAATKPLAEAGQQSPKVLSVLMLPADLSGESSLAWQSWQSTGWGLWGPWWTPKPPLYKPRVNKWAVVIGIADYEGEVSDLCHPDEDAQEMTEALVTKYGFPRGHVRLLLNEQATFEAIVSAIDWLAAREDADSTVVFFFSGHGGLAPDDWGLDGDVEWDGIDEGIVSYDWYGLSDGFLADKFSTFESEKFALIFGSCNSGGMFDSWLDKHGRPISHAKRRATPVDLQAPGRVICSASKADQYAFDYPGLGNTLFGYYFIDEGILDGKADGALTGKKDGRVSMEEALAYARPLVLAVSQAIQDEYPDIDTTSEPQIYDSFDGELVP
jgi:hypothetical protein